MSLDYMGNRALAAVSICEMPQEAEILGVGRSGMTIIEGGGLAPVGQTSQVRLVEEERGIE